MKKYVIKNKDGSEQTVMPAMHNTRKKAEETLMDHNKRSDCWLSVFDFAIEEEDSGVSSFEEAKQIVGFLARESLRFSDIELNMGHIGALIALNELLCRHGIKRIILFPILQITNKPNGIFKYRNGGIRFDCAFVVYATGSMFPALF